MWVTWLFGEQRIFSDESPWVIMEPGVWGNAGRGQHEHRCSWEMCLQDRQKGKGGPWKDGGESAVNLAESLRLLFCLFREMQQSSLPPALPVADVTWKHLDGPPAHGGYWEGLLWPPSLHVSWWPVWLVRCTTSLEESPVLCLWEEEKAVFLQNPIQVNSWDKNGKRLLS